MPRPLLLLLLAVLFAGLSFAVGEPRPDERLSRETARLQRSLDRHSGSLRSATEHWARRLSELGAEGWMRAHVTELEAERERTGTVFLGFEGDSLICWSGQPASVITPPAPDTAAHVRLPDATWLHARASVGGLTVHGLRPVWRTPPLENRYLRSGFHPSLGAPEGLMATAGPDGGAPLHDGRGRPMLTVHWAEGALAVGAWLYWKLLLVVLAGALVVGAWWTATMRIVRKGRGWTGAAVFLGGLFLLRAASLAWLPRAPFDRLPLFDPAVYATSFAFPSLGDLLINAVLMVLGGSFLRRAARHGAALPRGHLTALLVWGAILLLAFFITHLLTGLVQDSSIELDLHHVRGLGPYSALALLGMALLLAALLLLSATLIGAVAMGRSVLSLLPSAAVALAVSIVAHHLAGVRDTAMFLWPVPLVALLLHARSRPPGLTHAVLGLAVLAAFGSHLLTREAAGRERRERLALAERLAMREDPVVEQLFRETTAPRLRTDPAVYALLADTAPCGPGELDQLVRKPFFGGYWERYDVRLFAFGTHGQALCATDADPPRSFSGMRSDFTLPTAVADMPDLFIEERHGQSPYYHARVAVMPADTMPPGQLIVELYPRSAAQGLGFPALLLAGDDPVARRAERYAYARYEGGQLVERSGGLQRPLRWNGELGPGGARWYTGDGHEHFAKGDPKATLVVLSTPVAGLFGEVTAFSYLFALFSVLLAVTLAVRAIVRARGLPAPGIGAKVRTALVLFAAIGLVLFGIGAQRLLARQYEQRFDAAILEKARSVHQELQHRFDGGPALGAAHAARIEPMLADMGNVFLTDITVYTVDGRMLATSRPQIFAAGLLGPCMDAMAYVRTVLGGVSAFTHRESIGTAVFRTAHMPLRDRRGNVLAHIALPGFADQVQQEEERAGVLVAVVNLFVPLFALSMLVAVFISNWTTRPLDLLKNALSRVALQGANEPIRYRGGDEVGRLVEVYNRKVEELRESAERLARGERESAWREMARQVAHEIKNPLTPMKLSVQHFQRTWDPGAPDARERLERFTRVMVEQIDALGTIAGEFSNFAQMPRAREEDLDMAEVSRAALDLFHGTPGVRCELVRAHDGPLPVRADREQLLRVFNNLLKNAVQSIPDGREGRITVTLRSADGEAIAEVRDNGTGIAEADRERIFRPNFTTKGSGMGLGLAMVQRMVEGAGGRVWFSSAAQGETPLGEGTGSTFFVALPFGKA